MSYRSLHFMSRKATILRANYMVDITTIRDRLLTDYSTVKANVPVYLEPAGGDVIYNGQVGSIALDRFLAYFPRSTPVLTGDVLLSDGVYYEVRAVEDFSRLEWHIRAECTKKNLQQS